MKKRFLDFGRAALTFALAVAVAAGCRKDEIPVIPGGDGTPSDYDVIDAPADSKANPAGLYLLNEGNMGGNNAQLDFLNFRNSYYVRDVFAEYNPDVVKGFGDTGNDVQVYDGKVFAVLNGSHKVEIMDAGTVRRIAKVDVPNGRSIAFDGDNAYVTSWVATDNTALADQKGALYRISLDTYKVTGEVTVGYQPEQLVIKDGKAYVANSGGMHTGYDNTVSVVDLKSMSVEYTVDVAVNLSRMVMASDGTLWVSSLGNYFDVPAKLYWLEQKGGRYEVGGSLDIPVSAMAVSGNDIYVLGTTYDSNWTPTASYYKVNASAREVVSEKFITDGSESGIGTAYAVAVNPVSGDVYIADVKDYVSSGELFCYSDAGKLRWHVRTGVLPGHIAFL